MTWQVLVSTALMVSDVVFIFYVTLVGPLRSALWVTVTVVLATVVTGLSIRELLS